jgi:hypothetical protein
MEDDTRARSDLARLFDHFMNYGHSLCLRSSYVSCCQVYTLARLTIDSNIRNTLENV